MIPIDDTDLIEARRLNLQLAKAPRFHIRNRLTPVLIQTLLSLSQTGSDRRVRRQGVRVHDRTVSSAGESVRLRVMRGDRPARGVVLDFHGGGWVIDNARMNDPRNAAMVQACDVVVVSVDYRLAGRTPVEGLMRDCLAGARWLLEGGLDEGRDLPVIVMGESAGGHLAAATLLGLKSSPELLGRVVGAVLYYGVYDLAGTESVRRAEKDTLVLYGPGIAPGLRMLTPGLTDEERRKPPLSPLYGDLRGLPPALMIVGERDALLDDTVAMAGRWAEAGRAELHRLPEAPHGFLHFPTTMAAKTMEATHIWIRERLKAARATAPR